MSQMRPSRALAAVAVTLVIAGEASAQTMSTGAAQYNAGYGRTYGSENQPVNPATRDANGNRVIVDGVIQTGADQSVYAGGAYGAGDAWAGAGGLGGATAIGNNLVVVTQGSWNTVIIDSTQINNGDVTANAGGTTAGATAAASPVSAKTAAGPTSSKSVVPGLDLSQGGGLAGGVGDLTGKVSLDDRP